MKQIFESELKKIEIQILEFVTTFCNENGITYYLCGGTLLGAIRHEGFIPWDDDIDIMIPRKDYNRLIEIFPNSMDYELNHYTITKDYPFLFATVYDKKTKKIEHNLRKKYNKKIGVNIDIFPIDGLPNIKNLQVEYFKTIKGLGFLTQCATYEFGIGKTFISTIFKNAGIGIFKLLELLKFVSLEKILKKFDEVAQKYDYENSEYIGITSISHYGIKEINLKIDYFPTILVKFEGKYFNAPKNYNIYLSKLYGDYMKLPPLKNQVSHHNSICFWK